ncbi:lipopolysaccharide biosynthesis protein [Thermoflavimicrobium daqui]|uniref:Polysaccharide biosynthesis protein n=1 Tax=Thermoflavimicrobium daqui TaxID=2137476 RepID=A0A364K9M2_9BACL|nr:oligosaccharide flippase family protein [Thermoflavimicrobium daqui]RAL26978.1 hypothetical protein DL897_02765 [Thermoflavimicrobium daqui]
MKQLWKRLASDSLAFAVVTIGNKFVAFFLFPIFIAYLSLNEYADWGVTNTVTLVISYLFLLGMDTALAFYYHDVKTDEERKSYLTAAVLTSGLVGIAFVIAFFFVNGWVSSLVYEGGEKNKWILMIALLSTVFSVLNQLLLGYLRLERRKWPFMIFGILQLAGSAILSVYFVVGLKEGLSGIFIGQIIGQCLVLLGLVILLWNHFRFPIQIPYAKHLLKYGVPLIPTLLTFWVLNATSRLFVYHMISPTSAAIFDAASRVASYIVLLTASFQLAWRPFSMSIKDRSDAPQLFSRLAKGVLIVGSFVVLLFSMIAEPFIQLIAGGKPAYHSAYPYMWALSFSTILNVLHLIIGVGLFFQKKTVMISRIFSMVAVIYLIGSLVFIPVFGLWAVCGMNVLTYLLINIFLYYKSQKIYPVPFRFPAMLLFILMFIALMSGVTYLQMHHTPGLTLYYLFAILAWFIIIFASGLVSVKTLFTLKLKLPRKTNQSDSI